MADSDENESSKEREKLIETILTMYKEGRILDAQKHIVEFEQAYGTVKDKTIRVKFELIKQEAREVRALMEEFSKLEGWEKVYSSGESTCRFKSIPNSPVKSIQLEGIIHTSFFNIVARPLPSIEVDMYKHWVPCTLGIGLTSCTEVAEIDLLKKLAHMTVGMPWPMSNRDIVVYGYGCDLLDEGKILCVVRSHDVPPIGSVQPASSQTPKRSSTESQTNAKAESTPTYVSVTDVLDKQITIPTPGKFTRVIMNCGGFLLTPQGLDKTHVSFLWNIDPRMEVIPTSLLNWALKQMSHVCFRLLAKHAQEIGENSSSPYVKRMEEKRYLYDFLQRRYAEYIQMHTQQREAKETT